MGNMPKCRLCTLVYWRRTRHAGGILCGTVAASPRPGVGRSWRCTIGGLKGRFRKPAEIAFVFCTDWVTGNRSAVCATETRFASQPSSEDFQGDCGAGFGVGEGMVMLLQVIAACCCDRGQSVVGERPAEGAAPRRGRYSRTYNRDRAVRTGRKRLSGTLRRKGCCALPAADPG